jgi:hypothetical protein
LDADLPEKDYWEIMEMKDFSAGGKTLLFGVSPKE